MSAVQVPARIPSSPSDSLTLMTACAFCFSVSKLVICPSVTVKASSLQAQTKPVFGLLHSHYHISKNRKWESNTQEKHKPDQSLGWTTWRDRLILTVITESRRSPMTPTPMRSQAVPGQIPTYRLQSKPQTQLQLVNLRANLLLKKRLAGSSSSNTTKPYATNPASSM